jgi:Holliday junction resolvase RusA-like endonuclease
MCEVVSFVVPGNPKGSQRHRSRIISAKDGRQFVSNYTPSETKAEREGIRYIAAAAMQGRPLLDGPLVLEIRAFVSIPRSWSNKKQRLAEDGLLYPDTKPDYDNIAKNADALKGVVWRDDAQVSYASFDKQYSTTPRLEFIIKPRRAAVAVLTGPVQLYGTFNSNI